MKQQVKIISTGLDMYLIDARNDKLQLGKATFEQEFEIKYKGETIYFDHLGEWCEFVAEHFTVVKDNVIRIEYRTVSKDTQEDAETREDIDILGELETALMSILDKHGIEYDMDNVRAYIHGEDLK